MKQVLAIVLLCIVAITTANAQQEEGNKEKIELGNKQLNAKQYIDAVKTFSEILKASPADESALSGVLVAYTHLDKIKEAQPLIDNATKTKPNDANILIISGKYYGLKYQFDLAVKEFEKALPFANDSLKSSIYSNIASMKNQLDELDDAKTNARKAISLNEKNETAYINLGYAQYQLREYSDALDSYSLAITINPSNPQSYFSRGMAYLKANDKKNGCADFQRACKLGNKNGCVQYGAECAK